MQIQKIQIISDLICYGSCSLPDEEVEQHPTILATGRVWLTGYNFSSGFDGHVIGRRRQFSPAQYCNIVSNMIQCQTEACFVKL